LLISCMGRRDRRSGGGPHSEGVCPHHSDDRTPDSASPTGYAECRTRPQRPTPPLSPDRVDRCGGPACVRRSPAGYRAAPDSASTRAAVVPFCGPPHARAVAHTRAAACTRVHTHAPPRPPTNPCPPPATTDLQPPPTLRPPLLAGMHASAPRNSPSPPRRSLRCRLLLVPPPSIAPGVAAAAAADATARRLAGAGCRRSRSARSPRRLSSFFVFFLLRRLPPRCAHRRPHGRSLGCRHRCGGAPIGAGRRQHLGHPVGQGALSGGEGGKAGSRVADEAIDGVGGGLGGARATVFFFVWSTRPR